MPPGSPGLAEIWEHKSSLTKRRDTYSFIDPFRFRYALNGVIVLITNAHRGIGRACALDFASAGARVVMTAKSIQALSPLLDELKERYPTNPAYAIPADFLDPTLPRKLVAFITQNIGPIDILLNVSPPGGSISSFAQLSDFTADWWSVMELSLRAPIALIHAVLPSMIARGHGTIVSITPRIGIMHVPFTTSISTSSSALIRFHHGLHDEVGAKGIKTFVMNPGLVASHMHDPDMRLVGGKEHFEAEPRMQKEMTEVISKEMSSESWCGAGLASGTMLALCCEGRAGCLAGLYVDAEKDLEEMITEAEKGEQGRVQKEKLYVLKMDQM